MRRGGFINGLLSRSPYFAAFSWRRFVEVDEWLAPGNGVDLALAVLREPLAEDKLAGMLIGEDHRARPALIAHDRAMATPIRPWRPGAALIDIDGQEPRCRAWT